MDAKVVSLPRLEMQETTEKLGYLQAVRMFSRNAKLYVLHVVGMDMIHGTWTVLFNLYLLAIGFDIKFIGLRIVVAGVAGAILSVPAGIVSDRIGRKAGFILGDGIGATLGLINILTVNKSILLTTAACGAFFSSLHHVSEPPFMHENSKPAERVHLFSISDSFRTGSAMLGSLLAGFLPLLLAERFGKVTAYRWATFAGLALWFLSLIPAVMLRRVAPEPEPTGEPRFRGFFSGIRNPVLIGKLVLPETMLALGAGFVLPLSNVFFHEGLHRHEGEIGTTFAIGQLTLALGALAAPFLVARMSKVSAVVASRFASIPFILVLAFAMQRNEAGWVFPLVIAAWAARTAFFSVSSPIESAFNMEVLTLRERATLAGFDAAAYSGMSALGAFISTRLMDTGDFSTPFFAMATLYAASTAVFWFFFRDRGQPTLEVEVHSAPMVAEGAETTPAPTP